MKSFLILAIALVATGANSTPVGDALDRPAVIVRAPERTVLLAAALAGSRIVAVGERGIVVLSDDEGARWRQSRVPTSVTLTSVRFADARRGWAVGHGGVVLHTDDGGETWAVQMDGRRAAQLMLEAAKASADANALKEAERMVADGPDKPLLDLLIVGDRKLIAVGAYGLALISEDGGRTWASWSSRLPNPKGLHIYAVRRRGDTLLMAGEQGLVMLSSDAGRSFRRIETPYKGTFFTAELLADDSLFLAGLRGTAMWSADGGSTWSTLQAPMPVSITASAVAADGRLYATNQAGFVLGLQGDRLVPLNAKPLPPINGLLITGSSGLLVLSVQGAIAVPLASGALK
jgi:photosystem II stability/assembly factor-like uncharacterized protein